MTTVKTILLSSKSDDLTRAAQIWRDGGLVAFPTETVYGLGADARNDHAVAQIYAAKGRPLFNPLIVHVPDVETARRYVIFSAEAEVLAAQFWPGALTLVLPLRADAGISPLVTAGLETLAIRVPQGDVAQGVLRSFDGPVAAPSANPSGRVSPTSAAHVIAGLSGRIDAVIDGGQCGVGVESTIVGCVGEPALLRLGGVPAEAIEAAMGRPLVPAGEGIVAPGQLASHYAPEGTMRLNVTEPQPDETLLGFGPIDGAALSLSETGDLVEAAANLFECLHQLNALGAAKIAVSPVPDVGLGRAINDRLARAAAPRD